MGSNGEFEDVRDILGTGRGVGVGVGEGEPKLKASKKNLFKEDVKELTATRR